MEDRKIEMKKPLISHISLLALLGSSTLMLGEEFRDAGAWLEEVEAIYTERGTLLELTNFDPAILQDYFRWLQPGSDADRIRWKLAGLAAYGSKEDDAEISRYVTELQRKGVPPEEAFLFDRLAAARGGDMQALEALAGTENSLGVKLLAISGNALAQQKLFSIATDVSRPFFNRFRAMEALAQLYGDSRVLAVALSDEFLVAARNFGAGDLSLLMSHITGQREYLDCRTDDEVRKLAQRLVVKQLYGTKKLTVRGGIDWSKHLKRTELGPGKTVPVLQPAPRPKPDKPDVAAVAAQKPPANNAGALIAAGAALAGVLAVLIWFR